MTKTRGFTVVKNTEERLYCSDFTGFVSVETPSTDGKAKRYDEGKARLDLVPSSTLYGLAKVLEYGSTKYDDHNWRRGMKWSKPYACAMRHLLKWYEGEECDQESGHSHLFHVLANVTMLIEYGKTCPQLDDRYKGEQITYKDLFTKE